MNTIDPDNGRLRPLWTPSAERCEKAAITQFRKKVLPSANDSDQLWEWSVRDPGSFWSAVWHYCNVIGDPGEVVFEPNAQFQLSRFMPNASLNMAENLLAERPGSNEVAIIALTEAEGPDSELCETRWSWQQLRTATAALAAALKASGVGPGDRVAAWMPNLAETIITFLAASSIGAVFTSTSADFGLDGVVDRFGQTEPKVLVAADGYRYGGRDFALSARLAEIVDALPSLEKVLVVDTGIDPSLGDKIAGNDIWQLWDDFVEPHRNAPLEFTELPYDHPLYILYSSGTTGKPKCMVHRSGGILLKHLVEHQLHSDIRAGDKVFYFTTCGWMMWNWLVSCLATGASIVLYDGHPTYQGPETLFKAADAYDFTLLGVSAKYIDSVMKSGYRPSQQLELTSLRTICSTGSPLSPESHSWVYEAVKEDLHVASISGGTDLCGCLVAGDPSKAVFAGEIQAKGLGMAIDVYTEGATQAPVGQKGELVCTQPFPSMPLEFWNDPDGQRYRAAYFERFLNQDFDNGYDTVWAHGDYAAWTPNGGIIIHGRSDATLNASGIRIGTAEIYRVVEQFPEVSEAIAIGQQWQDDTRIVLFVKMAAGYELSEELKTKIKTELRTRCSPRHVPAVMLEVADIPRTRSGKIVELAVTDVVHGQSVNNIEALANPEALEYFANRVELK